jgi:glycosyltransferase involved in cell wall biosynthesis
VQQRPLVSIVTPSFNGAEFLEETIRSVLAQDYPRIEYLVMDAGSTDGTLEILERYRGRLQFVSEPDGGAADAINRGFRKAKGEILAWLGADDLYLPGAISTAVAALGEDPAAAAVYGGGYWIDENGRTLGRYPTVAPYDPAMFRRECPICQPACFMRRKAVEAVNGLDASLHSAFDYDLWVRLSQQYPFRAIPQHLAQSRMHSRNKSLGEKHRMFEECIALLRRYYGYVPVHWVYGYVSFLRDRTDQFFTPLRPSAAAYLRSLAVGARYNTRHPLRYTKEWLATLRAGIGSGAPAGEAARLKCVAIDLTPMLPGGDNGGIKLLALELVRRLAALALECEFVLLTSAKSHAELAGLEGPNVRRVCVAHPDGGDGPPSAPALRRAFAARRLLRKLLRKLLPPQVVEKIGALYARLFHRMPAESPLLRRLSADLLFCPFTGIGCFDPAVPVVCVVADLQYLYYPEFFSPEDRHGRERNFRQVSRAASRLVCISEYTRGTVVAQPEVSPARTTVIHIAARERLARPDPAVCERVLSGLQAGRFLLYPANFWRHKNHEMLLTAFGMYRAAHAATDLKLVLTGAPSPRRDELQEATRRMGLSGAVIFAGYLPDEELAALLYGCAAMIFPSLFEGFGMPVLEAMGAGVPVLCGNLTSLPEIAGAEEPAALLFDPRRPVEIVAAIERLESEPSLRAELIERGRRRAAEFSDAGQMAARYWEVFQDAVRRPTERPSTVYGVFEDGWTGPCVTVVYGHGAAPRRLTVTLRAPEWMPSPEVTIRVHTGIVAEPGGKVYRIPRGERQAIALDLPEHSGSLELLCSPTFQPGGQDPRQLGCLLESAAILEGAEGERQLPREAHAA